MSFKEKYIITPKYLTAGSKRRSGKFISPSVKFIVAHDTGNAGSTAANNVRYYENSKDKESASAHIFVDDKQILECIPVFTGKPEKAWHVIYNVTTDNALYGFDANDAAIGVEYCFGSNIDADESYRKYIWIMAYACFKFGMDPKTSVVGHFFLDPDRKTDPMSGLAKSRRTYEQLLKDIVTEFADCGGTFAPVVVANRSGTVKVSVNLNIRKSEPNTRAIIVQTIAAGTQIQYVDYVEDGQSINGNSKWFKDSNGNYFWSGGVVS
jgi:N-acetylmuramoyl-L-alanine amidase